MMGASSHRGGNGGKEDNPNDSTARRCHQKDAKADAVCVMRLV